MISGRTWRLTAPAGIALATLLFASQARATSDFSRPITVRNPSKLASSVAAERIFLGPGYKPSMALLPNNELVLLAFRWDGPYLPGQYHEYSMIRRSSDFGRTWTDWTRVQASPGHDLIGREHWLTWVPDGTPNGILFSTATIVGYDWACPAGTQNAPPAYVNRSTDGGRTWTQTRIGPTGFSSTYTRVNRNVVTLPDGRLMIGVGVFTGGPSIDDYLWTSSDKGLTWQQSARLTFGPYTDYRGVSHPFANGGSFIDETWFDEDKNGKLTAYVRLNGSSPIFAMDANPPTGANVESADRILSATSNDGGLTWGNYKDVSSYGSMYARVLHLTDGRSVLTYTQRDLDQPLGLRAVLSNDQGETWDFKHDLLILDANTTPGWFSGGGFGNTVQLPDGSLISAYSFQNAAHGAENYQTEVVRWSLPAVPEPTVAGALIAVICLLRRPARRGTAPQQSAA